jgi:hypothetical protein
MMMKKYLLASYLIFFSMQAQSALIRGVANGNDSGNLDFWGVKFKSGNANEFIESVEFDISQLSGLFFDFDETTSPGGSIGDLSSPLITFDSNKIQGLDINTDFSGDVSTPNPTSLKLTFAPQSFGATDFFWFTADTDSNSNELVTGIDHTNLLFTVIMENGNQFSDHFQAINANKSKVIIDTTAVPVPAALWLFGSGLLAITVRGRKAQALQA